MPGGQTIEGMEVLSLLRPDEVAKILRLSKPRIYQLARDGEIAHYRIGKSTRFELGDVKEFMRLRRREKGNG